MLTFVEKYGRNYYSQNGEDGIIQECLKRIGIIKGKCCEFGAADGFFCSNTRRLIELGWGCLLIEADEENFKKIPEETKLNCWVTPANVQVLVPSVDVLSIDIDGMDYEVWKEYDHKPAIVIIEINSSLEPMVKYYDSQKGASYRKMLVLGIQKGYFLLCHTGNLIFVDEKYLPLFPEVNRNPIAEHQYYFNEKWLS